jgi:hypothetical protein
MNNFGVTHLKDDRFDAAQSKEMQLLFKVDAKRISYAIIQEKENRLLVFYDGPIASSLEETLKNILAENTYLHATFATVKASVQTLNFTFIPAQYYTRDDIPGYERLIQATEQTKTFVSSIDNDGIKCVIAPELAVINPIIAAFPDVRIFSQAEPLVEAGLALSTSKYHELFLKFSEGTLEACFLKEGSFAFYNVFAIETAEDLNYFLLMIVQQAKIEPAQCTVTLLGYIGEEGEYFRRIERYFRTVQFADGSSIVTTSEAFDSLPTYQHLSLLSLRLCEL